MCDYKFKTPLKVLLEHFSMDEINNFSYDHAKFIDEAFARSAASYKEALETCPEGMQIEKWQILCNLKEFKNKCLGLKRN